MLLVQLPPDQERDDDRLDYFVRGLPEWMCVAVELRHPQLGRRSCLRPVEPPPRNLRGDESRRPPPCPASHIDNGLSVAPRPWPWSPLRRLTRRSRSALVGRPDPRMGAGIYYAVSYA